MNLHKVLSPIQAQFIQQGGKLVGTGAVGDAVQGASVALSADGNTAIVGGPYYSSYAGATWIDLYPCIETVFGIAKVGCA
jgi:hypothetical protein